MVGANWNLSGPEGFGGAGDDGFDGSAPGPAVDVAETSADLPDDGWLIGLLFLFRSSSASKFVDSLFIRNAKARWTHALVGLKS
jgi:hypothetical protein